MVVVNAEAGRKGGSARWYVSFKGARIFQGVREAEMGREGGPSQTQSVLNCEGWEKIKSLHLRGQWGTVRDS